MSENPFAQIDELPWQHEVFFTLSRLLKCKIHVSAIDGVLVLRDLKGGRDVINHRKSVVRYLSHIYDGLDGLFFLVAENSGWSAIETREDSAEPTVVPVTEKSLAGALAFVSYLNSEISVVSRWAH